jgi:hypothetical protein
VLPAPLNVSTSKAVDSNYPFRTSVTWDAVSGADYYRVYRNGSIIEWYAYSTSYDDTSGKPLDTSYSYTVTAHNYSSEAATSAESAQAWGEYFYASDNLWYGGTAYGYIGASGEYDYYRVYPYSGGTYSYYFIFDESQGLDVYGYLYVNGSLYNGFDSSYGWITLNPNDEVVLAVRAYDSYSTGSYEVRIDW